MPVFRFTLEYDGSGFAGWQVQDQRRTVQGTLEDAIADVTGRRIRVVGAGRTDAGVHAEGQVASATLETHLKPPELWRALNAVLPEDLAVVDLRLAAPGFHARRDARSKLYRYRIWNGSVRSPLRARRSHTLRGSLDLSAMRAAAKLLEGTHDFSSFQAAGSETRTTSRTLSRIAVEGQGGAGIEVAVEGPGFLRHMVRNLVGTLVEVGQGRRRADAMPDILAQRSRAAAGPTAPARGLTLIRVSY